MPCSDTFHLTIIFPLQEAGKYLMMLPQKYSPDFTALIRDLVNGTLTSIEALTFRTASRAYDYLNVCKTHYDDLERETLRVSRDCD